MLRKRINYLLLHRQLFKRWQEHHREWSVSHLAQCGQHPFGMFLQPEPVQAGMTLAPGANGAGAGQLPERLSCLQVSSKAAQNVAGQLICPFLPMYRQCIFLPMHNLIWCIMVTWTVTYQFHQEKLSIIIIHSCKKWIISDNGNN
jgi:hypothetical protein